MHSWRVLILPWLGQKEIYDRYRFDEPWDGPNNRKLHDLVVSPYVCASHPGNGHPTAYLAVVGPETMWRGAEPVRLKDVVDGSDQTIHLVEVTSPSIHWMEPRDLEFDRMSVAIHGPAEGLAGLSSGHPGGANVLKVSGAVRFVSSKKMGPDPLRAMLTIASGEAKGEADP
jgi:Protein of unknown function (DUF1559)